MLDPRLTLGNWFFDGGKMKFFKLNATNAKYILPRLRVSVRATLAIAFACAWMASAALAQQKSFASAEEAVKAAIAAARSNDDKQMLAIFGAQAKELLFSGDPVADQQRRAQFIASYDERNRLVTK